MATRGRGANTMGADWDPMRSEYETSMYETNDEEGSSYGALDHTRLYVTNIPRALNEEGLRSTFANYGTLTEVHLSTDPSKRYGLIKFETPGEAKLAMLKLNHTEPLKMTISVAYKQKNRTSNNQQTSASKKRVPNKTSERQTYKHHETSSREQDFCNDNVSTTSSRQRTRPDVINGNDENYLRELDDMEELDPDLDLELERLRLQAAQLLYKQRLRDVKLAERRTMSSGFGSRCVMADGKIVVRTTTTNDDREHEGESAGAGDSPAASRACVHCGARAEAYCARCGVTPYCGPGCQQRDWARRHRAVCHNLARTPIGKGAVADDPPDVDIPAAIPLRQPRSPADETRRARDSPAATLTKTHDKKPYQNDQKPYQNEQKPHYNNNRNNNYANNSGGGGGRQPGRRPPLRHEVRGEEDEETWPAAATAEAKPKPVVPSTRQPPTKPAQPAQPKPNAPTAPAAAKPNAERPAETVKPGLLAPVGFPKKAAAAEKPLVPAKCLIDLLAVGSSVLLSAETAASQCASDVAGHVCLSLHEDYQEQYMSLCDEFLEACEGDQEDYRPSPGDAFAILNAEDGAWYRARLLSPGKAALLDASRLLDAAGARCKRLQRKYADLPEFCCTLNAACVKLGDSVKCTIKSRSADGRCAVSVFHAETDQPLGDGELARWLPAVEVPPKADAPQPVKQPAAAAASAATPVVAAPTAATPVAAPIAASIAATAASVTATAAPIAAKAAPPAQPSAPGGQSAKAIPEVPRPPLYDGTDVLVVDASAERLILRAADPTASRLADLLEQDVALYGHTAEPLSEPPTPGQTVVARFTDGIHYRALCRRTSVRTDKYLLEYTEYGNSEVSCLERLHPCPESLGLAARPVLTSAAKLPALPEAPPPPALAYLEALKGQLATLSLGSGEASAPSGSEVTLVLKKTRENVNKKLEELCTPDWKKVQDSGKDVLSTDVLMLKDVEYLPLPSDGCLLQLLDAATLQAGAVAAYPADRQDHALSVLGPLSQRITEYCESELGREPYMPRIEELCIARFPLDGSWYRAVLCDLPDGAGAPTAIVAYLDFGNVCTVEATGLRKMQRDFVTGIPALASTLEIRDFPALPSEAALKAAREFLKVDAEGAGGELRASKCEMTGPGFYTVDAPDLLAAMAGL